MTDQLFVMLVAIVGTTAVSWTVLRISIRVRYQRWKLQGEITREITRRMVSNRLKLLAAELEKLSQREREELLLEAEAHAFYKTGRSSWLKRLKKSLFHRRNSLGPVVEAADFSFDFGLKKLAAKFPRDPVEDLEFSDSDIEEDLQRGVLRYGQDESSIRRWLNRTRREVLIKRIQLALVRITGRAQRSPRKSHTKK